MMYITIVDESKAQNQFESDVDLEEITKVWIIWQYEIYF